MRAGAASQVRRQQGGVVVLLSLALLTSGCFSYQEEVWLEWDGSGRAEIDLFVADTFGESMPIGELVNEAGIRTMLGDALESFEVSSRRGSRIRLAYSFADGKPLSDGPEVPDAHVMDWDRTGLLTYRFDKSIEGMEQGGDLKDLIQPMRGNPAVEQFLSERDRPGFRFWITVHFPGRVVESDATELKDRSVATWKLSLGEVLGRGRDLTARVERGPDMSRWLLGFGGIACVALLLLAGLSIAVVLLRGQRTYPGA